jgi:CheY-like chemotaxis protein/signal transduction histidine kinase/HAMP domain-containing protein
MNTTDNNIKPNSNDNRVSFRKGLGRLIIIILLLFSIVPSAIISSIIGIDGYIGMNKVKHNSISTLTSLKSIILNDFFENIQKDILIESSKTDNIILFSELQDNLTSYKSDLHNFTDSEKWKSLTEDQKKFHKSFIENNGYSDLLFLDIKGNVLYNIKEDDVLGTNLLKGKYAQIDFSNSFIRAVESHKPVITDLVEYGPDRKLVNFILNGVFKNEKLIGVIAIPLPLSKLNEILKDTSGMGKTGIVYFIGRDLLLRSSPRFDDNSVVLNKKIESNTTNNWLNDKENSTISYQNFKGDVVIGNYSNLTTLEKLGLDWVLITEIDESEADPVSGMMTLHIILLTLTIIIIVIILALIITSKMVSPILKLTNWAKRVSKGDLSYENIKFPNNEMGEMNNSFREVIKTFRSISDVSEAIAVGDYGKSVPIRSDKDQLGKSVNLMRNKLEIAATLNKRANWVKDGTSQLNEKMRGDLDVVTISRNIINFIVKYLDAQIGALYLADKEMTELKLTASYAFTARKGINHKVKFGEGLVGQAAFEKEMIFLTEVPDDYIRIKSGLGETVPQNIVVVPIVFEKKLVGVIEIGSIREFDKFHLEFFQLVMESIGISINSSATRTELQRMLQITSDQAEKLQIQQEELTNTNEELQTQQEELKIRNEELQVQQEELKVANEELEEQTKSLKKSEEDLKTQQEELQVTNEELEEKTKSLELQKKKISDKNMELEVARDNIEQKAKELEISSKYKSEFLANMSHELRTPLNSLLILSRDLADNKNKNLSDDQIESSEIIYKSGNDLLNLINEILDLSKIESGKMHLNLENIKIQTIKENILHQFKPITNQKQLLMNVNIDSNVPKSVVTDIQRLEQIIKNLMSNAIKFTDDGEINCHIHLPNPGVDLSRSGLNADETLAISVMDTGVGIPKDKQLAIFEAFQQADGGTSRKYGGTGLGLSISRELAKLLNGEIMLRSEPGKGSTFTLYIPLDLKKKESETEKEDDKRFIATTPVRKRVQKPPEIILQSSQTSTPIQKVESIDDDRNNIKKNDKIILIIEDDPEFAKILCKQGHIKEFKCIASATGEEGLILAEKYMPDAIILDIKLPGIDGLSVLDKLKENPKTRHIPVHMMSAIEETINVYKKGAIGYLTKPVKSENIMKAFNKIEGFIDRKMKDLLIIEDDDNMRKSIKKVIGEVDVKISEVKSGQEAIDALKNNTFDCMVLDLGLPDMSGFDLLKKLEVDEHIEIPPIIVYTGKDLTKEENDELQNYTNTIIIKGVKSAERLLDETALFLHRVVDDLPDDKQKIIANLYDKEKLFQNKKILLVDDDMRNVFALSKVLKGKGMNVIKAVNGQMALDVLEKNSEIDLILMDIMMPVMDGYEATKKIRKQLKLYKLPIIALTAKAMKDDREKCIEAGANDYMAKPVNIEKLLSLMRVWLYKK